MPHHFQRTLPHITAFFLGVFAMLALTTGYWAVIRRDVLSARPDNPRLVFQAQRIERGAILDRNDHVLAESNNNGETYLRRYYFPAATPVLGYTSIVYGDAGIEASYSDTLTGSAGLTPWHRWREQTLLGLPQTGFGVQLTLDITLQQRALDALDGRRGAVAIVAANGDVMALVSSPTFDANTLESNWEVLRDDSDAPLLNRATQAQYRIDDLASILITVTQLRHQHLMPTATQLAATWRDLGLSTAPPVPLATIALTDGDLSDAVRAPSLLATGESNLQVSPLSLAWAVATLANGGNRPVLRVVSHVQHRDGTWVDVASSTLPQGVLQRTTATAVIDWLAAEGRAPENAAGYAATAFQPDTREPIGWWVGLTAERDTAVAVVVEGGTADSAFAIANRILSP